MERRRTHRTDLTSRATLEMSLETWRNMRTCWSAVLQSAKKLGDFDRVALAEAKVSECETQITRVQAFLSGAEQQLIRRRNVG